MKKLLALILATATLLALLSGCGQKDSTGDGGNGDNDGVKSGGTVIAQIYGDVMTFNPDILSDDNLYHAAENMYNKLVKLDANCNIIPDLAESWDYSDDGYDLTFHLKKNAKWHDGEPVTAADVKYTFETIKANTAYPLCATMAEVDSIEAVDDHTAVFHMNTVDMGFVANLSWYACYVLPQHIYDNGQDWSENDATISNPIGSGAFKFSDYKMGESLTLVANPDYHDGAPTISKIVYSIVPEEATAMQALLNGELDYTLSTPFASVEQLKSSESVRLALNALPSPQRLVFNFNNETLADPAVRTAIAYCIDREDISAKAYGGIYPPEYSAYPSMSWAANKEDIYPSCDVAKAESILQEAGYTKDADGYYIRGLTIDTFEVPGNPDTAKLIADNCKKAGIEVSVQVYEYNSWSQKVEIEKDFSIELQGGFMGPDPATMINKVGTGGWANVGDYSNARIDELLALGNAEASEDARKVYYDEMQAIIVEDLPYINIVEYASYMGINAKLQNTPTEGAGQWGWEEWSHAYFE